MVNIQVRMYKENLSYSHTVTLNLDKGQATALMGIFFEPDLQAKGYKGVWPTNVMVRENGKLVSYKSFKQ